MTEKTLDETLEKWEKKTDDLAKELKLPKVFTVCGCKGTVVTTEDGKKHFEIECKSKKDREEVAAIFEEEVILRVNPKVVLENEPAAEGS
ncbi:unnamed protein product [marine sediment metagenome]|uniref:Uncharacterized protein n=1 Tax=marine sediment metagenome TaxID=412755 RepID=X1JKR4_9ZZZZ